MIAITPAIRLKPEEISETFVRASGPGGQNVNKVSTAVQLRFDVANSPSLPPAVKARLLVIAGSRMTKDGVLVLTANRFRTQARNRSDAQERLVGLIQAAAVPPVPRRATKPTYGSKLRKLEGKRHRGEVKAGRGKPDLE